MVHYLYLFKEHDISNRDYFKQEMAKLGVEEYPTNVVRGNTYIIVDDSPNNQQLFKFKYIGAYVCVVCKTIGEVRRHLAPRFNQSKYTFGIIKGPTVARGQVPHVLTRITEAGFAILDLKTCLLSEEQCAELYRDHIENPYYRNIQKVMCEPAVIVPLILQYRADPSLSIDAFRSLIGSSSDAMKCEDGSLRHQFGGYRWGVDRCIYADNAIHGSDSEDSVVRESSLFGMMVHRDQDDAFAYRDPHLAKAIAKRDPSPNNAPSFEFRIEREI